jgi:hypothetical protein
MIACVLIRRDKLKYR